MLGSLYSAVLLLLCLFGTGSVLSDDGTQNELIETIASLKDEDLAIPLSPITTVYPSNALSDTAGASILLRLFINKRGSVDTIEIAYSSNPGVGFEESAIAGARSCSFKAPRVRKRKSGAWRYLFIKFEPKIDIAVEAVTREASDIPPPDTYTPVDAPAEMIHKEPAKYPRMAQQIGIEGTVWIGAYVAEDGKVAAAIVKESSGHASLDEAALDAAYKYQYRPAMKDAKPIGMWVFYKAMFEIIR